jgi:hypothetical protein
MHGKIFAIDYCRNRHIIETFHEKVVSFLIITSDDLFTEGEILGHISAFMVTSQQHYVLGIIQL